MTGSADEEKTCAVSDLDSTKPSSSEHEPSREPDANGPSKRSENVQNNELQDLAELIDGQCFQETNQDFVLADTDISVQLNTLKQRLKDLSDGHCIPHLERLYSRILKWVIAIRSREGCKGHKLLILRHLLKFGEEDNFYVKNFLLQIFSFDFYWLCVSDMQK